MRLNFAHSPIHQFIHPCFQTDGVLFPAKIWTPASSTNKRSLHLNGKGVYHYLYAINSKLHWAFFLLIKNLFPFLKH